MPKPRSHDAISFDVQLKASIVDYTGAYLVEVPIVRVFSGEFSIMLTPAFDLSQTDEFVIVKLIVPYAKISDVEFHIEETVFLFYMKPYYLRLNFPGEIVEDGREKAQYDVDKGHILVYLPKVSPGQHFDGLDMLTALMAPKSKKKVTRPSIEILPDSQESAAGAIAQVGRGDDDDDDDDDDFELDWFVDQALPKIDDGQEVSLSRPQYGFANRLKCLFSSCDDYQEFLDLPNPDQTPASARRQLRIDAENKAFDPDRYLYDLFENADIQNILAYKPKICKLVDFTDEEKEKMRRLPRREYLLDKEEERAVYLGLVDILFAYCYNHRITEGENTVESSWTVAKLSPLLSWLHNCASLRETSVACCRRSLIYPLHRHFGLTLRILEDLKRTFDAGRPQIVKCLLELHFMVERAESRQLLNELYLTDYCIWAQTASRKKFQKISEKLAKISISRADLDLDLEELESVAHEAIKSNSTEING
ncbi:protein SHQ1 homolog isoform X2 [Oscarella lobularis]|uniref:protein SHQ1 homolog isoform X2 n=1 Tax=Oscarella lobularis TaxID=121494 RepID=UPI00331443C0